jgi:hypothetical protein
MLEMLLDALMDDELKKLLEELQELMDKNNPSDIEEKLKGCGVKQRRDESSDGSFN